MRCQKFTIGSNANLYFPELTTGLRGRPMQTNSPATRSPLALGGILGPAAFIGAWAVGATRIPGYSMSTTPSVVLAPSMLPLDC